MPRKRNPEHVTKDERILEAIAAVKANEFDSIELTAAHFSVPVSTLHHRVQGCPSRRESCGAQQKLTPAQEQELIRWITQLSITGYSPRHDIVQEMAEAIR